MNTLPGVLTTDFTRSFQPLPGEYEEGIWFFPITSTFSGAVIGYSCTVIGHAQPGSQLFAANIISQLASSDVLMRINYEIHIPMFLNLLPDVVGILSGYSRNIPMHRVTFDIVDPESIIGHKTEQSIRRFLNQVQSFGCKIAFQLTGQLDNLCGALGLSMNSAAVKWFVQKDVIKLLQSYLDSSYGACGVRYIIENHPPVKTPNLFGVIAPDTKPVSIIADILKNSVDP